MKRILLACTSIISIISYAADAADMYIPLEQISVDTPEDESERQAVTIKTLYDGGVRHMQQVLNISKRGLTSVHDLPRYRNTLNLPNLTTLNASKNYLTSDDLGTILRTLVQLKTLNMGFNNVTSLAEIPSHQHLETLLLNDNKVTALNVADCFGKLSQLRQGAFHGNQLIGESFTNVTGSYPSIVELWFDHDAITERLSGQLIQACPNLTSELRAGSNLVQKHYSKVEAKWDNSIDCNECECNCVVMYSVSSIIGGIVGTMTSLFVPPLSFGVNCAIFVPAGVVLPLTIRIGNIIRNYCRTKPEDRYVTIPTRRIAAEPRLLDLIEDDVEVVPDQEQVQEQEE